MTKLFGRFILGSARRFKKDEKGATAIEYGLIAALISVAIIAGASTLGGKLSSTFSHISNCLDSTTVTSGSSCMTGN